jgi:asparaginyl-tRNA synthetase
MARVHRIKQLLKDSELVNSKIQVKGWVRTNRTGKNVSFIELNDGSCLANIQIVYTANDIDNFDDISKLLTGSSIVVEGELVSSQGGGQSVEIHPESVGLIGACDSSFPLQKKRHSFEYLRTIAHLRARTNSYGAVFRVRSRMSYAVHSFFQDRGFVNVHTPIITASDCEGAGEMFRVTTLPADEAPKKESGEVDFSKDFFDQPAGLTVSGQLSAEMFALSLGNVYTFGPTFRAENSNTTRHACEFWMIEPEMAFCDLAQDCQLAQEFMQYIAKDVLDNCADDMQFFNKWVKKGTIDRLEKLINSDFETITYTEAIKRLQASGQDFQYDPVWGPELQTEHERWLTGELVGKPLFVVDYPKDAKAFYMRQNDDNKTVSAVDLLVPGVGEIIGGSQREERYDVLSNRIQELGMDPKDLWWYLESRKFGSAPHAGFGLGFARAVMYVTGMENVRDVIPFPRTPGNCSF